MDKKKILIVDDEKPLRDTLAKWLKPSYTCLTAPDAAEALKIIAAEPDLVLMISDVRMPGENGVELVRKAKAANPRLVCMLLTAYGTVDLAVAAMKIGANDFFQKPITDLEMFEARLAEALENAKIRTSSAETKSAKDESELGDFTGRAKAMQKVYSLIRKVAPTNATVLIEGESGTGKELVARALHALSPRAKKPFIAVECAALSKELLESELFGYTPGTFTGGLKDGKAGCFEAAEGGTLFLDEIGEIDLNTQVKLLRVLESRTITRLGSTEAIKVNFRLVTATNKNLQDLIRKGLFREDLYYRLNVIDIQTPALREHPEDIAPIAARFLKEIAEANGRNVSGIEPEAMKILEQYAWPGNVRELKNVIEKMVILSSGDKLTTEDLPREMTEKPRPAEVTASPSVPNAQAESLADAEKRQILSVLKSAGGNKSKAADLLGISRRTLHRKLNEWEIK